MSEPVRFPRSPVRPIPRSFEDQRWAERHRLDPPVEDLATADLEARALSMGAVAFLTLSKPQPERSTTTGDVADDCRCTGGFVCRRNAACPRLAASATVPEA